MTAPSPANIILIDFENVQPKDVAPLRDLQFMIKVFCGANQTKTTIALASALQPLGTNADWVPIPGVGPNALDFHIAFYIGKFSMQYPGAAFYIVSRDKGFDPLIRHLSAQGLTCKRLQSLSEIQGISAPLDAPRSSLIQKCVAQLLSPKVSKPRKRNRLEAQIKQHLGAQASSANIQAVFESLQRSGVRILPDGKVEWPSLPPA